MRRELTERSPMCSATPSTPGVGAAPARPGNYAWTIRALRSRSMFSIRHADERRSACCTVPAATIFYEGSRDGSMTPAQTRTYPEGYQPCAAAADTGTRTRELPDASRPARTAGIRRPTSWSDWAAAAWGMGLAPDRTASVTALSTPHPSAMADAFRHSNQAQSGYISFFTAVCRVLTD